MKYVTWQPFFTQTRKIMASGLQNTGLQWVVLYFLNEGNPMNFHNIDWFSSV